MAWTFGGQSLETSPRDALRALIDDINPNNQLIQDEVLDYLLAHSGGFDSAVAAACDILAMRFGVDVSIGKASASYARLSQIYSQRAAEFRKQARSSAGGFILSGGQSLAQKEAALANGDAVQPAFSVGMNDYEENTYPPSVSLKWVRGR